MKVCPVCKARVFDDMDTCYGCLHRFESSAAQDAGESGFDPEEPPDYQEAACKPLAAKGESKSARPRDVRQEDNVEASPIARDLVLHIAVPKGAAGVRVSVDFAGCAH
ncbi:hypothetical protein [uncultured Ellagibacter sp.]|uniref:hypothetical protein n=1 Tax=uncultured Ellagibacter sp. TaxID=2137580 RepID=UPI0026245331|nr:hypothetical protein [uncultured Ellagibacter sp.]